MLTTLNDFAICQSERRASVWFSWMSCLFIRVWSDARKFSVRKVFRVAPTILFIALSLCVWCEVVTMRRRWISFTSCLFCVGTFRIITFFPAVNGIMMCDNFDYSYVNGCEGYRNRVNEMQIDETTGKKVDPCKPAKKNRQWSVSRDKCSERKMNRDWMDARWRRNVKILSLWLREKWALWSWS